MTRTTKTNYPNEIYRLYRIFSTHCIPYLGLLPIHTLDIIIIIHITFFYYLLLWSEKKQLLKCLRSPNFPYYIIYFFRFGAVRCRLCIDILYSFPLKRTRNIFQFSHRRLAFQFFIIIIIILARVQRIFSHLPCKHSTLTTMEENRLWLCCADSCSEYSLALQNSTTRTLFMAWTRMRDWSPVDF